MTAHDHTVFVEDCFRCHLSKDEVNDDILYETAADAVYPAMKGETMIDPIDPSSRITYWAAQECTWQGSGEMSVAWMLDAWAYATEFQHDDISYDDVLRLGVLVEPGLNRNGIRTVGVRVGYSVKMSPELVPTALAAWVAEVQAQVMEPAEAFRQYEEIHPFIDGNGRSGSIIFNWLNGTLGSPIHPPNLWDDPRRDIPGYPDPTQTWVGHQ